MKRRMDGNNLYITEYNSFGEFISDISSLPENKFFKNRKLSSQEVEDSDTDWRYSRDYARAVYLATNGWDEASEKMSKKVKISNTVSSTVRSSRPAYGVVGSQASVPRYLQGIPTNMVSRQTTYSKQKVVTITKGISYAGSCSPKFIMEESIKALELIQALESKGQRVRLNVMLASTQGDKSSICKICVKQPDERLNISKIAFPLAHPAMLRRFLFKWIEVDPFIKFDLGSAYGYPSDLETKKRALQENEYYIPEKIEDMDKLIEQLQGQ